MESVDFGKKLIEIRKHKGLTQGEVAEICNVTIRTIQRIESGIVKPRASTIKIISQTLGFDFFETSDTGNDGRNENQTSKLKDHTFLWYIKDLFNLKTNAMRKISILSVSTCLIIFMFVSIFNANAQTDNLKRQKSLTIERNEDTTVKRVEAAFTHNLTLDSLVQIKRDLHKIGITIHYKKIEFDIHNLLLNLDCQVICNDGFSGSFGTGDLSTRDRNKRIGFYRDYTPDCKSPFSTGLVDK
ncbi:helix-turn-helix domain-containing protein [Plebeiibacterium marinum]|uniref:Helix-turn-helix domain-containing protein n=1 Tax=Plebeiibacterium marinum TaxID=2992111 RepID=A0AAE3MHZ1_9BACT|nr:helix-turn-helix transcriptional regulator [Plebeiobacterium marinum]MCW3808121.1 helix-turn-helix domain-containing protein [Plebeiobacterium marinum]